MRFTQVKMHSADPESLATFYGAALDCEVVLPLTVLDAAASRGAGVPGSEVGILVLSLPGSEGDTTLELISTGEDRSGDAMLTFLVEDVEAAAQRIVDAGGSFKGEIVEFTAPSGRIAQFVFMNDPEGNVVDLWSTVEG